MSEFNLIRASEIAEYVYCHRAWWLKRVEGVASRNVRELEHGTDFHETHERQVQSAGWLQKAAFFLIILAILIILFQAF